MSTMPWPSRICLVRWGAAARNFRRGGVGVLLEEVMLDLPRVVDAEPVAQLGLVEGVLEQLELATLVPGPRELVLIEDAEAHVSSSGSLELSRCLSGRARPPASKLYRAGGRPSRAGASAMIPA